MPDSLAVRNARQGGKCIHPPAVKIERSSREGKHTKPLGLPKPPNRLPQKLYWDHENAR